MVIPHRWTLVTLVSTIDSRRESQVNITLLLIMTDPWNSMHFNSISIPDQSIPWMDTGMI
jgi:hypothetical protein